MMFWELVALGGKGLNKLSDRREFLLSSVFASFEVMSKEEVNPRTED